MPLKKYRKKRNLKNSPEPKAVVRKKRSKQLIFVVQKHAARSLHYDLRLEMEGVLKSWAIPKGPSMNPKEKRLAVHVEDHPYDYKDFEGIIPEGYGAGAVIIWDKGTYTLDLVKERSFVVTFHGKKLKGAFSLVRFKGENWLLIKKKDRYAQEADITKKDRSIVSRKKVETFRKLFEKGKKSTQSPRRPSKTPRRKKRRTAQG